MTKIEAEIQKTSDELNISAEIYTRDDKSSTSSRKDILHPTKGTHQVLNRHRFSSDSARYPPAKPLLNPLDKIVSTVHKITKSNKNDNLYVNWCFNV